MDIDKSWSASSAAGINVIVKYESDEDAGTIVVDRCPYTTGDHFLRNFVVFAKMLAKLRSGRTLSVVSRFTI